ncbi:MAG: hypothetical protein WC091_02180 [Sulfuricellaceae bacterium]
MLRSFMLGLIFAVLSMGYQNSYAQEGASAKSEMPAVDGTAFSPSVSAQLNIEPSEGITAKEVEFFNYILWLGAILGGISGLIVRNIMYKKHMAYENVWPLIPAILIAWAVAAAPGFISAYGTFGNSCFKQITDEAGFCRTGIPLAEECCDQRENISALGIRFTMTKYKAALGSLDENKRFSTGYLLFFYGLLLSIWSVGIYRLLLLLQKLFKDSKTS